MLCDLLPEGADFGGPASAVVRVGRRDCVQRLPIVHVRSRRDDPRAAGRPARSGAPVSIDRDSDTFKAANDVCAPLLPNGGQGFVTEGTNP